MSKHDANAYIPYLEYIIANELNFLEGNAVKCISRARLKDNHHRLKELNKAKFYIEREIKRVKEKQNNDRTRLVQVDH